MSEFIIECNYTYTDRNGKPCEKLVRCRDCKNYRPELYNNISCEWFMFDVEPDGFCAWGDRKQS